MAFQNPMFYNEILQEKGLLDDMYKAMSKADESAVFEAYRIFDVIKGFPKEHKQKKNYDKSSTLRTEGNNYFQEQKYHEALEMYNKALLSAPKGSLEMLHAYGNRSALLYHREAYSACIKDIETCRKLGCTGELSRKLNKRYDLCQQALSKEHLKNNVFLSSFGKEFFMFNVMKHPDIPCLAACVDIVSEAGGRKAVATKDIPLGTVVAVETAIVTHSVEMPFLSCYHCQKMTFNLSPCENCCYALFCSEQCQETSFKDYHNIECQLLGMLEYIEVGFTFRLVIKSVLKVKSMCKNWSTFIKEANNVGVKRLNESQLNEVYDVENYSSILCYKEEKNFIHGTLYNISFFYACVLRHLEKIEGFFPDSKSEGLEAKKSFGKLCLNFHLNWDVVEFRTAAEALQVNAFQIVTEPVPWSYGWFAFTGKLRHSCEPNLLVVGLNNKVALVAIRPITKMSELTVSYIGHWYEQPYGELRRLKVYKALRAVCRCRVCENAWGPDRQLDPAQMKLLNSWQRKLHAPCMAHKEAALYRVTCAALAGLQAAPNTAAHAHVFAELRAQLRHCQYVHTGNVMIFQPFSIPPC